MNRILNLRGRAIAPNEPPPGCVYIGRRSRNGWQGSKWGNPYKVGPHGVLGEVLDKYRRYVCGSPDLLAALPELAGLDLLCWYAPTPCHGDVLLDLLALRIGGRGA